jgi:hypothetical protein
MPNKSSSGNIMFEMHQARNYEGFWWIDNSIWYNNEIEDCEEAVVEQIAVKHQNTSEDQEKIQIIFTKLHNLK